MGCKRLMILWVTQTSVWQKESYGEVLFGTTSSTFFGHSWRSPEPEIFLILTLHKSHGLEMEEFLRAQFQVDCKILETVLELVMYMACIFLTFRRLNCIYFLNEWL